MATPHTVAFHTLGCKLNFSETSSIKQKFIEIGFQVVDMKSGADIFILNTCSVTDFADRKCRKAVRQVLNYNPQTKIVVIGCYAQLKPEEIANIPGVDLVLGAAEKFNVIHYIDELAKTASKGMVKAGEIQEINHFESSFSFGDRTRSFLKIQDGCDYKCSFCTIPLARGKSRSDSVAHVVENARNIASKGIKEIVLTGVNIGDFGNTHGDDGQWIRNANFLELIQKLDELNDIHRFRISSIEPNLCSNDIIEFVAQSKRFVPHFHMPLQSGSDKILRSMRRRYTRDLYKDRVEQIKSAMPHACIGADVIVGFPGESEADFKESIQFINHLDISYLHVFTYSERANTPAANMPDIVPIEIRRQRNEMLRILSEKKRRNFYDKHLDSIRPVLYEKSKEEGKMTGFTDNYIKIESTLIPEKINSIEQVRLKKIEASGRVSIGLISNLALH